MLRSWLAALLFTLLLAPCSAALALEVNQASEAQLDGLLGIGPSLSGRILRARFHAEFKDWPDLMARVQGIGASKARQLSSAGLTVAGARFAAAP